MDGQGRDSCVRDRGDGFGSIYKSRSQGRGRLPCVELELHCFGSNGMDVPAVCVQGRFQGTERWVGDWGTVLAPLHLASLNTITIPYIFQELETHPRGSVILMTFPRKCRAP